jgi:hypothetical protein
MARGLFMVVTSVSVALEGRTSVSAEARQDFPTRVGNMNLLFVFVAPLDSTCRG